MKSKSLHAIFISTIHVAGVAKKQLQHISIQPQHVQKRKKAASVTQTSVTLLASLIVLCRFVQVTLRPTTTCHHPTSPETTCSGETLHHLAVALMCSRDVDGPELRLFVFPYSTCLSPQHHSGSVRQCDALPVSARCEDTPRKHQHHNHQGEHRGGVQQPGARSVCVCVCVTW